ncbi:hypothetical protein BgiBS90_030221 [Biomphalaria glabrata]|nr:hypothetical protein BgiBS90_030221 [Biomphalaria glabrata]
MASSVLGQPKCKDQDWFDEDNLHFEQLVHTSNIISRPFDEIQLAPKAEDATHMPKESIGGNKLLTDKEEILVRWAEHFSAVLNCPSSISAKAIARLE